MTTLPDENDPAAVEYVEDADLEASLDEKATESAEDVMATMHAMIEAYRRAVACRFGSSASPGVSLPNSWRGFFHSLQTLRRSSSSECGTRLPSSTGTLQTGGRSCSRAGEAYVGGSFCRWSSATTAAEARS